MRTTGVVGSLAVCGTDTVEAAREPPEPSAASFPDFRLDAPLPGILPPAPASFVLILGALSSVSQLHYTALYNQQRATNGKRGGTYPEKLAKAGIVWLAWLSLCVFQILCKPEAESLQHAVDRVVGGADGYERIGRIEIVPVLKVGRGLQELGGQREADGGEVGDANEPAQLNVSVVNATPSCRPGIAAAPRPSLGQQAVVSAAASMADTVDSVVVFRIVATHAKHDMGQGRAAAPSEMNGRRWTGGGTERCEKDTHFFKMPMKMRSLELSLWFSSGGGAIVGGALDADILEARGSARQRNKGAEARLARTSRLL